VKTIVVEPESHKLEAWLRNHPIRISSALLRTEVVRAVRNHGPDAVGLARQELADVDLVRIDDPILDAAADLEGEVRTLDAIHVATARALGSDLAVLVSYDERMARVAAELGIEVVSP
jgi:hypothetical protein